MQLYIHSAESLPFDVMRSRTLGCSYRNGHRSMSVSEGLERSVGISFGEMWICPIYFVK